MNPLTLVKRIQSINAKEADLGISDEASWHAKYKDSAYVFVGGIPYDLTEGDLLAVFAQYGEIVDVNLVRDKATGKSKGFAFVAYEDQRSTTLAVDNLNGAQLGGRTIRVDHVAKYKKKEEEDEETERLKREERGVCRAFQKGECKYGDSCKFSHDEQRAADTGWGAEEDRKAKWANDKFDDRSRDNKRSRDVPLPPSHGPERDYKRPHDVPPSHGPERNQPDAYDGRGPRGKDNFVASHKPIGAAKDRANQLEYKEDRNKRTNERRSSRYEPESKSKDEYDRREEKSSRTYDTQPSLRDTRDTRDKDRERDRDKDREKRSTYTRDSSPHRHRARRDDDYHRSRR